MAVRFKFRSSSTFDSIDIGNQSFISIRDLKSEIVKKKHLDLCQDFDLVFSDSLSGQEYTDENTKIPSGSSVIIKRVPASLKSSLRADDASGGFFDGGDVNANIIEPPALNVGMDSPDEFGIDMSPLPDENLPGPRKVQSTKTEEKDFMFVRCSKELVRCNELDASTPCQRAHKDSSANDCSTLVMQSKPKTEEQVELDRTPTANHLGDVPSELKCFLFARERSNMPAELKCFLCKNFFVEAVMIPCCQHSFCEKCILLALAEDNKCPMCSSTKCKAKDLLPNVSLRQAIERFRAPQLLPNDTENDLHGYAPDGESGIQVKESSYAANVTRRDHARFADKNCETEFEGENDPQNVIRTDAEEADSRMRRTQPSVTMKGGERNFAAPRLLHKGRRTCYGCGSPDHFIRDCPVATGSQANHWNGDASVAGPAPSSAPLNWPGCPTNARPYVNMYGGPGMMMYSANLPSITPFGFPSYAPSMYGTYPFPSVHMKMEMGTVAPALQNHRSQPCHVQVLQGSDREQRYYTENSARELTAIHGFNKHHEHREVHHSHDNLARKSEGMRKSRNDSDEDHFNTHHEHREVRHSHGNLARKSEGMRRSHNDSDEDGFNTHHENRQVHHSHGNLARKSGGMHRSHNVSDENAYSDIKRQEKISTQKGGKDLRISQSDKSTSERELNDRKNHHADHRYEKHNRSPRPQYGSDVQKDSMKRQRTEHDERRSDKEFHHHSRSSKEHSYSSDSARRRREESSHRYRHSKERAKSSKEHRHDREGMTRDDDDYGGYYQGHKRKRFQ